MQLYLTPNNNDRMYRRGLNFTLFLVGFMIAILLAYVIAFFVGRGLDAKIDQQNTMLCESAKKSGNEQYITKCKRYYTVGDIKYLRAIQYEEVSK